MAAPRCLVPLLARPALWSRRRHSHVQWRPEEYRGRAYLQNHPRIMAGRDWAYDAINEVYFDDADGLLARIAYFERELAGQAENDLVGANWFLAVREEPVELPAASSGDD